MALKENSTTFMTPWSTNLHFSGHHRTFASWDGTNGNSCVEEGRTGIGCAHGQQESFHTEILMMSEDDNHRLGV